MIIEREHIDMDSAIGVVIAFSVLSGIFYLFGNMYTSLFQKRESVSCQWLTGFVIFLSLFAIVDIPLETMEVTFQTLVNVFLAVCLGTIAVCATICIRSRKKYRRAEIKPLDTFTMIFIILIVIQVIYGMYNSIYTSYMDTAYYNGNTMNAIYTNTMYEYSPYTGLYAPESIEQNDSYSMLIAVLARLFCMHPLVMINRIFGIIEIVAVNIIIYEIAYRLSESNKQVAVCTVALHAVMSIMTWQASSINEAFLWTRMAESKSMLANIYLPLVLLGLIIVAKKIDQKYGWILLGLFVFAGSAMSLSGIFMIFAMLGVGLFAIFIYHPRTRYFLYAVFCAMPCICVGMIRLL